MNKEKEKFLNQKINDVLLESNTQPASEVKDVNIVSPLMPYKSQTLNYERFVCKGYLKKYSEEKKLWQFNKSTHLRYFVLSHRT